MAYSDFVVKDEEFESASKKFGAFQKNLLDAINQYETILTCSCKDAVLAGGTHDAMIAYLEYVVKVKEIVEDLSGKYTTIVNDFIRELEQADDYLYDAGISNVSRDFSQERYQQLLSCLDDPWCSITDSFGDWLYDNILKIVDFFHLDGIKKYLQSCHRLLLDYNDEVAQGLRTLFDAAHAIDFNYGFSIPSAGVDYRTCYFSAINLTLYCVRDMFDAMAELIQPNGTPLTEMQIKSRLGESYAELLNYYNMTVEISKRYSAPTIEDIENFASPGKPWVFTPFDTPLADYIGDISNFDELLVSLFNLFRVFKDKLVHGDDGEVTVDELIANLTGNSAYSIVKNLVNDDEYKTYLIKEQLLSVLRDMSENYDYSGSAEEQVIDDCETLLKYIKKYGKEWYKKLNSMRKKDGSLVLDGRTIKAKNFMSFLDSLDNAGTILNWGDVSAEYLAKLFVNYSSSLEIIDSFERNYSGDETMQKAITQIRELYNKEFGAWLKEGCEKIAELGIDAAISALAESNPVMQVISKIEKTIDVTGEISGLGERAQRMYDSLTYYTLYSSSKSAYSNSLERFREQIPNTEEYTQAAKDLENCFNLHKNNLIKLYESMADASTGLKQAYYKYCTRQAALLSMKSEMPELMTFEEFCSLEA